MGREYERVEACYQSALLHAEWLKGDFVPRLGLILGSGLGELAEELNPVGILDYKDIEGFPQSTVSGHKGRFVFAYIGEMPVVIMQGRVHYYEGYAMEDVVLPVRLMHRMGAELLFLTNAAGGISHKLSPGSLMLITDQITSFVPSPLIGENEEKFGTRFPDMSEIYNKELQHIIKKCAMEQNIDLQEGVYIQFSGPAYETPAEIRMARLLGADACGMSTACEAVAANHMGMKICGISCITNMASGISKTTLKHEEVKETADRVSGQFKTLVKAAAAAMYHIRKE